MENGEDAAISAVKSLLQKVDLLGVDRNFAAGPMHKEVLNTLKISVWELDINSLTLHLYLAGNIESVNFLNWQERIHRQDRDFVVNQILDTINEKRAAFDCQFRWQTLDSRWQSFRMRGIPMRLTEAGKFAQLSGVLEDFTVYDAKIQEMQKRLLLLESQTKEKSDFFASITHELRTPMSGMLGLADLILDSNQLNDDNREMLASIKACGQTLLSLVNDTLDLSKLEARKLSIVSTRFSLQKHLSDVELLFSREIKEKKLSFVISIESDVPKFIITDSKRLQQILVNLVGNSIKFTPVGGGIYLRVEQVSATVSTSSLVFNVIDSGIGIKLENHQEVFEKYAQESEQTDKLYGGTGLGLSIVRELVGLLGGSLKVRSEPGRGTVFQFSIQVGFAQHDLDLLLDASDSTDDSIRTEFNILLAEDNVVNQKVASRLLEKAGHCVTLANNGEEAVRLFQGGDFDLILMDIQMPILSGDQATKLIREHENLSGGRKIPIVALTAHAMSGDREKYIALGMNDYVSKPIVREHLFDVIERCMFGRSAASGRLGVCDAGTDDNVPPKPSRL